MQSNIKPLLMAVVGMCDAIVTENAWSHMKTGTSFQPNYIINMLADAVKTL